MVWAKIPLSGTNVEIEKQLHSHPAQEYI